MIQVTDLQDCVDGGRGGAVEGGQRVSVVPAVLHQLEQVVAGDHAGGNHILETHLGD